MRSAECGVRNECGMRNAECGMRNAETRNGRRGEYVSAFRLRLLPSAFCLLPSAFCLLPSAFCLTPSALHSAFRTPHSFRIPQSAIRNHCTLAVTDALAASVKVQLLRLLPALEQAPDQTASRPFDTVSVIAAPTVNDADPALPTATLNPAGLDVTRSPLRPVAVSVSVAV